MSGAMREQGQADFDLERVMDLFDQALTSKDERVINSLRNLLMITVLTAPEDSNASILDRNTGPFRQLQNDVRDLSRRVSSLTDELEHVKRQQAFSPNSRTYPAPNTWPSNPGLPGSFGPYTTSGTSWTVSPPNSVTLSLSPNEINSIMEQTITQGKKDIDA